VQTQRRHGAVHQLQTGEREMLEKISGVAMFGGVALQFVTLCVWAWLIRPGTTPSHRRGPVLAGFSLGVLAALGGLAMILIAAPEAFTWEAGAGICAVSAISCLGMVIEYERRDDRPLGDWPVTAPGRLALAASTIGVIAMVGFTIAAAVTGETYRIGQ
jgi:hypothetical protein